MIWLGPRERFPFGLQIFPRNFFSGMDRNVAGRRGYRRDMWSMQLDMMWSMQSIETDTFPE